MLPVPEDKYYQSVRDTIFVSPKDRHFFDEHFVLAGAAIGTNPTDQLTHVWKGWINKEDGYFYVQREDLNQQHKIVHIGNTSEFDFTFDQNMQPVVTWHLEGMTYLHQYVEDSFETLELGSNLYSPRVELDHKKLKDMPKSDIILAYTYDGNLCFRVQREKYRKEYIIAHNPSKNYLVKIGQTISGEFGFQWV